MSQLGRNQGKQRTITNCQHQTRATATIGSPKKNDINVLLLLKTSENVHYIS